MTEHAPLAVVDDDAQFCEYMSAALAARGYRARTFNRGADLLMSVANGDIPLVILLDVSMPGMDGLNTLHALREHHPECQVVMMSGRGDARTIVEALRIGATDYIVKGEDEEDGDRAHLTRVLGRAFERADIAARVAAFSRGVPTPDVHWSRTGRMREVERLIERVADCDVAVLIRGESGSGKEVVARAIHARSPRGRAPFVKINCAALPAELLESELFGHERGAFTGADFRRMGKFEHAAGGTILLDEIGEMSPGLQAKILHVLQDATFTRVGGNETIPMRARVLTATHRDLAQMVSDGTFREDLYYRLRVIEIRVPPLRERRDEIHAMVAHFLARFCARFGRAVPELNDELRALLNAYSWPGNVRELENFVKRLVLLRDPELAAADLRLRVRRAGLPSSTPVVEHPSLTVAPPAPTESVGDDEDDDEADVAPLPGDLAADGDSLPALSRRAVQRAERRLISRELTRTHWNRKEAAERLGVSYKTLLTKIRELGLDA